jgi:hypothetical protein
VTDHSTATLVWQTDPPPKEIIAKVREHIRDCLVDLDEPGELLFSHVALEPGNYKGPAVILGGNEELNCFNASYHPDGGAGVQIPIEDFDEEALDDVIKKFEEDRDK